MKNNNSIQISRLTLVQWLRTFLPDISSHCKVQQLGKGVIYCRIIDHYYPGSISLNRINWIPKTEYENSLNLKILQNTFNQLKINITFDPNKVAKEKLQQNLSLLITLYKHLHFGEKDSDKQLQYEAESNKGKNAFWNESFSLKRYPETNSSQLFLSSLNKPYLHMENNQKLLNSSKYSVGKMYKEPTVFSSSNSPNKGKWSVNSHMFQNNLIPVIDRIKQILLKPSHDTQKIRLIKMLLNIPLNEEVIIKVEEDEESTHIISVTNEDRAKDREASDAQSKEIIDSSVVL